jgi:hypothetical protein
MYKILVLRSAPDSTGQERVNMITFATDTCMNHSQNARGWESVIFHDWLDLIWPDFLLSTNEAESQRAG